METAAEVRARLEEMVEKDSLGKEAAALLQRLSLFKGPISRRLVTVLAPKGMPRSTRMQAQSTLIRWGFAIRDAQHEILLSPDVQQIFPEDQAVLETLLTHIKFTDRPWWFVNLINTIGFLPFCLRFLETHPVAVLRLMASSNSLYERHLLDRALTVLACVPDPLNGFWSLLAIATHQKDLALKQRVYENMLDLYEQHDNKPMQQQVLIWQGDNAKEIGDQPLMLRSYQQAVALDPINRRLTLKIFSRLIDATLISHEHEEAKKLFHYAWVWVQLPRLNSRAQQSEHLSRLALMAEKIGLYDTARDCYAQAIREWESPDGLWDWAQFEHRCGQQDVACRLFALSMAVLNRQIDVQEEQGYSRADFGKLCQLRKQAITAMGCED